MVVVDYYAKDPLRYLCKQYSGKFEYLFLIDGHTDEEVHRYMTAMLEWCEQFTDGDPDRWLGIPKFRGIAFRDEADAFAFRMRWC